MLFRFRDLLDKFEVKHAAVLDDMADALAGTDDHSIRLSVVDLDEANVQA